MLSDNGCAGQWNCCHSLAHISLFVNLITQILCRCHPPNKSTPASTLPTSQVTGAKIAVCSLTSEKRFLIRLFSSGVSRDGKTICLCTVVERIFRSTTQHQHPNNRDILLSCLSLQELSNPALSFETTGSPKGIRTHGHKRGGIMKNHIQDYPTSKSCPQQLRRALATCCCWLRGHSLWTLPLAPLASPRQGWNEFIRSLFLSLLRSSKY